MVQHLLTNHTALLFFQSPLIRKLPPRSTSLLIDFHCTLREATCCSTHQKQKRACRWWKHSATTSLCKNIIQQQQHFDHDGPQCRDNGSPRSLLRPPRRIIFLHRRSCRRSVTPTGEAASSHLRPKPHHTQALPRKKCIIARILLHGRGEVVWR